MSYRVVNIYPDITDEENELRKQEAVRRVQRIMREHKARVAQEKASTNQKVQTGNESSTKEWYQLRVPDSSSQ